MKAKLKKMKFDIVKKTPNFDLITLDDEILITNDKILNCLIIYEYESGKNIRINKRDILKFIKISG